MDTVTADTTLDMRGKTITTYVVFEAAAVLSEMRLGEAIEVLTDDFEPFRHDIAAWCGAAGHELIRSDVVPGGRSFLVRKGAPAGEAARMAIVISSDGLEELLSPLGFALGGALEEMDVHLYFQGPAVRVLTAGYRPKLRGWARPFSRFAAAGMARSGHIPAHDKLRQLRSLGARIYACGGSLEHFKVDPASFIFDGVPIVEYLTFADVMAKADVQLYV